MSTRCHVCATENDNGPACSFCTSPLGSAPQVTGALPLGASLQNGAFSVGRVLGIGGFGITYVGVDTRLRRLVAIKEFFPYGSMRQGATVHPGRSFPASIFQAARDRFLHEAQVAGSFQHPNIVHVYTFFEENDTGYIVMELLRGSTLGDVLERGGPLPEETAVSYVAQVADALRNVHGAGFVHRDLKPDNIFLTDDGRVVLLDFGTAKERAPGQRPVTALVSPGYAPPEQYVTSYQPDPRSDVYSLAATLYHLLTGAMPLEAPERTAGRDLPQPTVLNPRISRWVDAAIAEGMSLDPSQRPPSITAFVERLRAASASSPTVTTPSPVVTTPSQAPLDGPLLLPDLAASLPSTAGAGGMSPDAPEGLRSAPPLPLGTPPRGPMPPPLLTESRRMAGHLGMIRTVDITADGEWVLSGSEDKTVRQWGVRSLESHGVLTVHDAWVSCVRASPDGRTVATASHDKTVRLIDLESREVRRTLRGTGAALSVAFSPRGRRLAGSFIDGIVVMWDAEGKELARTPSIQQSIWSVVFSPDGSRLAFGTWADACIKLWDIDTWREVGALEGQCGGIRSLAWSPDGRFIAGTAKDRAIRIWDAATLVEVMRLEGHHGIVSSVAFHPSGQYLASAGTDKSIRLWDLAAQRCVQNMISHTGEVLTLAFSRDGSHLASGSQDERVGLFTTAS